MKTRGNRTTAQSLTLRVVVAAEFAFSVVLLVSAMLLARSYLAVADTPLGFRPRGVLTLRTSLPDGNYTDEQRAATIERIVAGCAALPGVTDAAAVSTLPLTGESEGWGLVSEDNPDLKKFVMTRARAVTPGYFRTMGIRLVAGRDFDATDRGRVVGVVSETAARRLWPGVENPVGRRLRSDSPMTIVGIVEDTRASGLDTDVRPYLYVPFWLFAPDAFALTIRSSGPLAPLVPAVKAQVWLVAAAQPITHVEEMTRVVDASIGSRWFQVVLMGLLGVFAMLLAMIGIYGVLSYAVAQRAREIGIRLALGASRAVVVGTVARQAVALAAAGVAVGVVGAWLVVPVLRTLLYGVTTVDARAFAGAVLMLLAVALLAGLAPALRAAGLDPVSSLRSE